MREEFKGSTSHSEFYMLIDSATGLGKTGLVHTDMVGSYTRTRSARVAVTMVTQTVAGAYSSGGFVEIDATNQPGLYRWDHPNAGYVTAADSVVFTLKSPLARTENKEFRLVNINNQIAYAPNAEADAAGGLPISVAGALDLDAILADTDELQTNQGNWLTATGFSTHSAADVYTAFGDGSNLTTLTTATGFATVNPDNSGITAIKTKTDQLVFTVANQVDSNALSGGGSGATASEVRIEMDANSTKLASIVADTSELQTDWADGGRLDLLLDAIPTTPMRGTDSAALAATALSTAVWTGVPTGFLAATFPTTLASTTNITGGTITTVGTCTTNSDMRGTDGANTVVPDAAGTIPTGMALETTSQTILTDTGTTIPALIPTAGAIADQVWDETTAGHTTSGTYGGRVVRSTNSNVEVQITGSKHIAADVHEFQTGVITAAALAADAITAAALAADAVTEIQSGLALEASVQSTLDRLGFTLAALAGNCADPQTAAETYSIILGANTFTIDHTGLDATGTRTTATLTKS